MSSPIDNTSPAGRKPVAPSNPDSARPSPATAEDAKEQGGADDRVSLSATSGNPPADQEHISTLNAARETIAKLRELISADPSGALSAQRGLNTDTAASALRQTAA